MVKDSGIFSLTRKEYFMVSIFSVKLEANSFADSKRFQSFRKNREDPTSFHGGWKSSLEISQDRRRHREGSAGGVPGYVIFSGSA